MHQLYPDLMSWYQSMPWMSFKPGFVAVFYRFLMDYNVRHWVVRTQGKPAAFLTWQAMAGQNDRLWAALPEDGNEGLLTALLLNVRRELYWRHGLTLDFPAGLFDQAIQAAGFSSYRTLLWMKLVQETSVNKS